MVVPANYRVSRREFRAPFRVLGPVPSPTVKWQKQQFRDRFGSEQSQSCHPPAELEEQEAAEMTGLPVFTAHHA